MSFMHAVVIGLIQGFTEYFPISSSGHLIMFQKIFHFPDQSDVLYFFLHAGCLLALVVYLARDIIRLFTDDRRMLALIAVATIPTILIGYFFPGFLTRFFQRFRMVGVAMAVNGIVLFIASFVNRDADRCDKKEKPGILKALAVGIVQGMSVIPGTSRSGMTILASIFAGFDRAAMFRFAFLLSVPVVAGEVFFKGLSMRWALWGEDTQAYLIAAAVATVVSFFSLVMMRRILLSNKLWPFAIYCTVVGIAMAVFLFKVG